MARKKRRVTDPEKLNIALSFFREISPSDRRNPELWKYTEQMCSFGKQLFQRLCYDPEDKDNTGFFTHQSITNPTGSCHKCTEAFRKYLEFLYIISPDSPEEKD